MNPTENNAQTVERVTLKTTEPRRLLEGTTASPVMLLPTGSFTVQDMERFLPTPSRKREVATLHTAQSLIDYVNRHKTANSLLTFDRTYTKGARKLPDNPGTFRAIINYHDLKPGELASEHGAQWGDHVALYAPRRTPEWERWIAIDGNAMSQEDFAEFVEDNIRDIAEPTGAQMLALALDFQAKTDSRFGRVLNLGNGSVQLDYVQSVQGGDAKGQLVVPTNIKLGLRPFVGGAAYAIPARFRYRVSGGSLTFTVILDRPDIIEETALEEALTAITAGTELPAIRGNVTPAVQPAKPA